MIINSSRPNRRFIAEEPVVVPQEVKKVEKTSKKKKEEKVLPVAEEKLNETIEETIASSDE